MEENLIGSWEGCKNGLDEGRTDVGWDAAWGGGRYAEKRMATLFFFGEAKRSQLTKYLYRPRMLANQATS